MKTVKTFTNLAEAGFAHSLLESAGLHPALADEHSGTYVPVMALGMRLQVDEAEYEEALRVLTEWPDIEPPADEKGPSPLAGMAADPRATGRIPASVFVAGALFFLAICLALGGRLQPPKQRAAGSRIRTANPLNAAGERVHSHDSDNDGKPDQYWIYRDDKLVRYEADRNTDDRIDVWYYYASDGSIDRSERDANYDGKPDIFTTYRNGLTLKVERDEDFDGRIDAWDFHGSDGALERAEVDANFDGKPDTFTTYRDGRTLKVERDEDFDGRIDAWDFYGSDGLLRERRESDANGDGKPDGWFEFRGGLCVAGRFDNDWNGVPDYFITYKRGAIVQADIRPNDSPIITRSYFYEHGVLREEWVDEDADGKFDYRIEYDPFGKPSAHLPMPAQK